MTNKLTLISQDGQWKAELHAWKSNWIIYKSIGSECTVYKRKVHENMWGSTVDWEEAPAFISITNTYKGNGLQIAKSTSANASHAELKEYAFGFILIKINLDSGQGGLGVGAASLVVEAVEGRIGVSQGGLSGVVTADTAVVQQSIW